MGRMLAALKQIEQKRTPEGEQPLQRSGAGSAPSPVHAAEQNSPVLPQADEQGAQPQENTPPGAWPYQPDLSAEEIAELSGGASAAQPSAACSVRGCVDPVAAEQGENSVGAAADEYDGLPPAADRPPKNADEPTIVATTSWAIPSAAPASMESAIEGAEAQLTFAEQVIRNQLAAQVLPPAKQPPASWPALEQRVPPNARHETTLAPASPSHSVPATSSATDNSPTRSVVHWRFIETPLQREENDRLAQQLAAQWPRSLPIAVLIACPSLQYTRLLGLAGLARALADHNAGETILVDAALQGQLSSELGIPRSGDWSGAGSAGAEIERLVLKTDHPRLSILPAEGVGAGRATFTEESARGLLKSLKQRFRYLVIDPGAGDDPLVEQLALLCDASYLLVELGLNERRSCQRLANRLQRRGACLMGTIVSGFRSDFPESAQTYARG